jgi:hypothetical protein
LGFGENSLAAASKALNSKLGTRRRESSRLRVLDLISNYYAYDPKVVNPKLKTQNSKLDFPCPS